MDCDLRDPPQIVEQFVEVPTVLSFALLQQHIVEQIVDNPVPRLRDYHGSLQGFSPRTEFNSVGSCDPLPDPRLAASSSVSRDEEFQGGFRTLPRSEKKVRSLPQSSSARVHGHSISWTSAACEAPDPPLLGDMAGDLRKKKRDGGEQQEQEGGEKLRKQKKMLETFVQAVEAVLVILLPQGPQMMAVVLLIVEQVSVVPVPRIMGRIC